MTKTFLELYLTISERLKARMNQESKERDRHRNANNMEAVWISAGRNDAFIEALTIVRDEFQKTE